MVRVTNLLGFFVYPIASALVFPRLFFPRIDPVTGTLLSFTVFPQAFLTRPVLSALGNAIQQEVGQAGRITLALTVFGNSTVAIGLLPGYEVLGLVAPALLAALRVGKGLGLGGA